MDLQTPDSRHDLDVGMTSTMHDDLPVAWPAAADPRQSRLGSVIAMVGLGLLLVGASDALGRNGHLASVVPLFLVGLALIFGPAPGGSRERQRPGTSVCGSRSILGVGLLASYTLRSPLIFDNFDELAHSATLMRLLDSRSLFPNNPVLPVSTYFPGIELVTIATKWLTGLPLLLDQMIVLLAARVVLVLCVFLIVERACRSARAGGIGVLVYAAGPEFYSLGAQYGYQTLALTFAVAVVYLLFVSIDAPNRRGDGYSRSRLFQSQRWSSPTTSPRGSQSLSSWCGPSPCASPNDPPRRADHRFESSDTPCETTIRCLHHLRSSLGRATGAAEAAVADRRPRGSRRRCSGRGVDRVRRSCPHRATSGHSFKRGSTAPLRCWASFMVIESCSRTRLEAARPVGSQPSYWRRPYRSA